MRKSFNDLDRYERQHFMLDAKADADKILSKFGRDKEYAKAVLAHLLQRLEPNIVPTDNQETEQEIENE